MSAASSELNHEWSRFLDSWREVRTEWQDDVARQFSKQFMSQWEADFPAFLVSLEALEDELRSIERELS